MNNYQHFTHLLMHLKLFGKIELSVSTVIPLKVEFCSIITSTSVNVMMQHVASQALAISTHLLSTYGFISLCLRNCLLS